MTARVSMQVFMVRAHLRLRFGTASLTPGCSSNDVQLHILFGRIRFWSCNSVTGTQICECWFDHFSDESSSKGRMSSERVGRCVLRLVNFNLTSLILVDEMMDGTVPKFGDATRIFYFLILQYVRTAVRVLLKVGSHIRSIQISNNNFTFHCFFNVTDTSYWRLKMTVWNTNIWSFSGN